MKFAALILFAAAALQAQSIISLDAGSASENSCTGAKWGSAQQSSMGSQTIRYGPTVNCDIFPISNGTYSVTLRFRENRGATPEVDWLGRPVAAAGPGLRVFTATVNGVSTGPFDLFMLAGPQKPYSAPPLTVQVIDGHLRSSFVAIAGNASVSGIDRIPAPTPPPPPSITGVPCDSLRPAKGIAMVVNLPDGTCLPISVIAATGFLADSISIYTQASLDGTVAAQLIWALLTPR